MISCLDGVGKVPDKHDKQDSFHSKFSTSGIHSLLFLSFSFPFSFHISQSSFPSLSFPSLPHLVPFLYTSKIFFSNLSDSEWYPYRFFSDSEWYPYSFFLIKLELCIQGFVNSSFSFCFLYKSN